MEKKKALFNIVEPYFKGKGFFKLKKNFPIDYIKIEKDKTYVLSFQFKDKSDSYQFFPVEIYFNKIEEIIRYVSQPNYDNSSYKEGVDFFGTARKAFSENYEQKFSKIDLSTVEGFKEWGYLIKDYMEGEGNRFMDQYSYLPNVLKEMDRLEASGEYWNKILIGLADYDFRGLIISKLCNDPYFEDKIKSRDKIFYKVSQLSEWVPYYDKLKEVLSLTKPIYNVDA